METLNYVLIYVVVVTIMCVPLLIIPITNFLMKRDAPLLINK